MGNGTELGRVRGLGSAKAGTDHWLHHRLTAGSNLFLMLWLLVSLARLPGYDYETLRLWMSSSWAAVPMILLIVSVFYHFRLGLQTLIEDYQHDESRIVALALLNYFTIVSAVIAIVAILRIAIAPGAPV